MHCSEVSVAENRCGEQRHWFRQAWVNAALKSGMTLIVDIPLKEHAYEAEKGVEHQLREPKRPI